MLESERMIHERRMQIRLRRVAGITRLGKQAQIGQLQMADQGAFVGQSRGVTRTQACRVSEGNYQSEGSGEEEQGGKCTAA